MTNKIILESLKLKGFQNPTAIAEILNYVPNPIVALEMLLGVYEPTAMGTYFKRSNTLVQVIEHNELANKVIFKEYDQNTKRVWYLTAEDKKLGLFTDKEPSSRSDYHDYEYVKTTGYGERQREYSISEFNSYYKEIEKYTFFDTLEQWDNFGVVIEKDPTDLYIDELV